GRLAQHQGLAVNEIAARGQAAGPVDEVRLAPPDVDLAREDQPVVDARALVEDFQENNGLSSQVEPKFEVEALASSPLGQKLERGEIDDVFAELMGEANVAGDAKRRVDADGAKTVAARTSDLPPPTQPGPLTAAEAQAVTAINASSIRPRPRPKLVVASLQSASYVPERATSEIDPKSIPSGTRLAQLGAFESPETARDEWSRMEARFGDMLSDKSRVVQEAQSGGRTFYRLRAMGFVDLADARRFCSAVKAEGVDCIPVQVR
ncbi:MAG: SPOR domain-containing protein, partial [Pseudomonadota bacterium]